MATDGEGALWVLAAYQGPTGLALEAEGEKLSLQDYMYVRCMHCCDIIVTLTSGWLFEFECVNIEKLEPS